MNSDVKRGSLVGVACATIDGLGYYITDPDVFKALFVGGVGLAVSLSIFLVMKFAGKRDEQDSAQERTDR